MAETEREELRQFIDEVISGTNAGKIHWKSVNPTTFVWETGPPKNARVSLQRVERVVTVPAAIPQGPGRVAVRTVQQKNQISYLFQVYDLGGPNPLLLTLDTSNDAQLFEQLNKLFDLAKTGVSQKTLEFLKSILPS